MAISEVDNAFGQLLKYWRSQRNFSQLDLSMASDVSQRHISFIESGRSQPSRAMILKLAAVLDIPLRQQNKMLTTAGFAPIYSAFDLSAPEVAPIRRALDFTLRQQEPYPALVMDRYWNQLTTNEGAKKLFGWLLADREGADAIAPELAPEITSKITQNGMPNLMKLMLHPNGIKPVVENWRAIAPHLIHRVHRESLSDGIDEQAQTLFQEILTYPDIQEMRKVPTSDGWHLPLLTVTFSKGPVRLSFFSTITTLGTPQDITLQELRLECLFPADLATEQWFQA